MSFRDVLSILLMLICIGLGLVHLERPRTGLEIRQTMVGQMPATVMQVPQTRAPVVVLVHGFAGSRQMMQPYQMTLARAGYITISFDFAGHGRNPLPSPDGMIGGMRGPGC
ncbi:hypothetical protein E2K80_15855 [Rhodophyticola sp. CCM32]|uniref:hypothetical protein n=1 Tax=Rhodophyticola sp. CCM32 TaxID=2916397 RepID=UPI00107F4DF3|nr:hypothetical protein [Rhodophyticola sp. CCM32]QBY02021.1 hypothetical protein E2K80_15855 [Rhodophyticola sp. CCM32]